MSSAPLSVADLMTARQAVDPYPLYELLRPRTPFAVVRGDDPAGEGQRAFWPIMKYHDVYAALRDHDTFSSQQGMGGMPLVLLTDDPPKHTRLRKLVSKTFTPRRIAMAEPWIQDISNDLFDSFQGSEVDAVPEYTIPLPVKAIARILGIPGEEYQTFKRWTDALLSSGDSGDDATYRLGQMQEMMAYFGKMVAQRREHASEDLINLLVEGDADGQLSDWEILGFSILLLIAGNETTTNLMGNLLNKLANDPALYAKLRADRALIEPAIEEMLRIESPVQVLFRTTAKDALLPSGGAIPAGQTCGVFFGAANRDPEGWEAADEFRLDRNLKDHVAFGMGIHYCLGSPLARAEARITVNNLLDRFAEIGPGAGRAVRQDAAPIVYGFKSLPLRLG